MGSLFACYGSSQTSVCFLRLDLLCLSVHVPFLCGTNPKIIHFQKNESEIRRRLDAMKKMWEEDKLKPEIYVKMVQLTEGLFSLLHNYFSIIYLIGLIGLSDKRTSHVERNVNIIHSIQHFTRERQ